MRVFPPVSSTHFMSLLKQIHLNRVLPILMLCVSAPAVYAQISDRERDGLKGPVQTVRVRTTTITEEDGVRTETPLLLSHDVVYDKSGARTALALYDKTGNLNRRTVYTYDREDKRRSGLAIYNATNTLVRRVVDLRGQRGFEKTRTIEDFNEDGSFYRKRVLAIDQFGEMNAVAEYQSDGTLIKEHVALRNSEPDDTAVNNHRPRDEEIPVMAVPPTREPRADALDPIIGFTRGSGERDHFDGHGNWTRGVVLSSSKVFSSGQRTKTTEISYREFTYYSE